MQTSYQVIARRWRPTQFHEVVGQTHIVRTLKNAIQQNRIAHAYLFVGPRGTGKTTIARLFAKCLNCEGGPLLNPSNDSEICQSIMDGSCIDVIEIDGASNNSVEQIRSLREDCQYAPVKCPFKIYIIDEVHMLSIAAFNALLKTLEEPPAHVKFIFATTEANKVLPTIVSRCQRFEFRPIADDLIVQKLQEIANKEKIDIEEQALTSIARLAQGGMRDSQSILDQMISFCGDKITTQDLQNIYGLAPAHCIETLAKAIALADYKEIISSVEQIASQGHDFYRILLDLQRIIRDKLVAIVKNEDKTSRFYSLTAEALMRVLDVLQSGEVAVQKGLSAQTNFEVTLFRAVEASRTRAIDSVIKDLTTMATQLPQTEKKTLKSHDPLKEVKKEIPQEPLIQEEEEKIPTEEYIAKLPESTRQILDEKFRARFKGVVPLKQEKKELQQES
jgi:DNA polymerase III subunit gamma/tau